ncbi:MAG: hypothetical protein GXY13_14280 [Acidimicrobiales bacterium]|nr:hypothetical protein [Acidimicrobiales bacterium]
MDTDIDLDRLSHHLAEHGVQGSETLLARVVRAGRATGASPVAVSVLADRCEPDAVRVRAFLRVARHLLMLPPPADTPVAA